MENQIVKGSKEEKQMKIIKAIMKEEDFSNELINIAEDPSSSPEILNMLSTRASLLNQIAKNPSTGVKTLEKLTEDAFQRRDRGLLSTLGHNPSMSAELLVRLGECKDFDIRKSIIDNPNTPIEIVAKINGDRLRIGIRTILECLTALDTLKCVRFQKNKTKSIN